MKRYRLSQFESLTEDEKEQICRELAASVCDARDVRDVRDNDDMDESRDPDGLNGIDQLNQLNEEILEYERRYEISSSKLKTELNSGHIKETADVASWLIALNLRDRMGKCKIRQ